MMEVTTTVQQGALKDEYLDVSENMRQWANIRFAQMTLFAAITAGILAGLFQNGSTQLGVSRIALKIGGIIVTFVFGFLDQRAMIYWRHFRQRAVELEKALGFRQYTSAPTARFLNSANAVRVLYLTVVLIWVVSLIWSSQF